MSSIKTFLPLVRNASTTFWAVVVGVLLFSARGTTVVAIEPLKITATSGRIFSGFPDERTDDVQLWLRTGDSATNIVRPLRWDRIAAIMYQEKLISRDELGAIVDRLRKDSDTRKPTELPIPEVAKVSPETLPAPVEFRRSDGMQWPSPGIRWSHSDAPPIVPTVQGLDLDAYLDGSYGRGLQNSLVVVVRPFDQALQTIALDGALEITLIAPQLRDFSSAPTFNGYALQRVGYWSVNVVAAQFRTDGFRVQVPLRAAYSELNQSALPYGLVNVRLVAAGYGTFEKSQDAVRLRPFAPTRDLLEHQQNRRLFPFERTVR